MYWKGPVREKRAQERRYKHLGEEGVVVSFTVITSPPISFSGQVKYVVGLIEVGGEKVMAQIVGESTNGEVVVGIGDRVVGVMRKLYEDGDEGVITYGTKFKRISKVKIKYQNSK